MDGAEIMKLAAQLGLTGFSLLVNVVLWRKLEAADEKFDALQAKRADEKDAMLVRLTKED